MIYFIITVALFYFLYRYYAVDPSTESEAQSDSNTKTEETSNESKGSLTPSPTAQQQRASIAPIQIPKTTTFSPRDQIAGIVQSASWYNDLTRICWPYIGKIVESQLGPTLEPLINLYLPKPFSKFRFTHAKLGRDPLTIDKMTVHKRFEDVIAMDLNVTFIGHPNISMKCSPLSVPFGIRELRWKGRLSILLRPLLSTLPLIGGIQASMISPPDLHIDYTGIANLAEFGPIERIVKMVLRDVISSVLVLPNRFGYVVSESVDYFSVYQQPFGIMNIKIERGRGFTKEKKVSLIKVIPDLYCKGTFGLEQMETDVQMNNLCPEWGTDKSFILSDLDQLFELSVFDKDVITRDDLGGSLTVNAQKLLENESHWYPLTHDIDQKFASNGEIYLTSQLYSFRDPKQPVRGLCVFSILIDRAKNLPKSTKTAACKVTVGIEKSKKRVVKETPEISKPDKPIPGIDPVNPVWNFSFDILSDDYTTSDVVLEVVSGRLSLGYVTIDATELEASDSNVKEGEFSIGNGATLRAKVILRGLTPDSLPTRVKSS